MSEAQAPPLSQVVRLRRWLIASVSALGVTGVALVPVGVEVKNQWDSLRASMYEANGSAVAMQKKVDELQVTCPATADGAPAPRAIFVLANPGGEAVAQDVPTMEACNRLRSAMIAAPAALVPVCVAR